MRAIVALVAVVMLAGCGGFVGSDQQSPSTDPADRTLLPGLSGAEVTNSSLLAAQHDELTGKAYRMEWKQTVTDGSGTALSFENRTGVVAAGGNPARERIVRRGPTAIAPNVSRTDYWSDDELSIVRESGAGSVQYAEVTDEVVSPDPPFPLERAYDAVDRVIVRPRASEPYVLEGHTDHFGRYENVSFRLTLSADGYLTAATLDGEPLYSALYRADEVSVELTYTLRQLAVFESGPTEPAWIETARTEIGNQSTG